MFQKIWKCFNTNYKFTQAIRRLGGNLLLIEAQYAKHIVLDKSLTDILTTLRINKHDIEEHEKCIDTLQTIKQQHEKEIQGLNDSLQKLEGDAQKHAAELSDKKELIDKCTKEFIECKKEIEKTDSRVKSIQDKVSEKQNQVDKLTHLLETLDCKYNKKFEEIEEKIVKHDEQIATHDVHMAKHDEQIATSAKDIDEMKKKQHHTGDILGKFVQYQFVP